MKARFPRRLAIALTASLTPWLPAQCADSWLPGEGYAGVNSSVRALTSWDPDGPGPASPLVVVAGDFALAGTTRASRIATWDPATGLWAPLGSGFDWGVYAVAALPNGDLIAGGQFTTAGGIPASRIARWDGSTWSPLGSGILGGVNAIAVLANGDLIVGGQFSQAGSAPVSNLARWDGANWLPLGAGVNATVNSLAVLPNGDVLAGGLFTQAGATLASKVARWDGATWNAVSATSFNGGVYSLLALPNGDFVAGGDFTAPASRVARWNGAGWVSLAGGLGGGPAAYPTVMSLQLATNGDLFAGGAFSGNVSRWNGASWTTVGGGTNAFGFVLALFALPGGDLITGGQFQTAGSAHVGQIARWSNGAWLAMGTGMNAGLTNLQALPNGDVIASAGFTSVPNLPYPNGGAAIWNGTTWSALSPPPVIVPGVYDKVYAETAGGSVIMCASEYSFSGTFGHVFTLSGSVWSPLLGVANGSISSVDVLANGAVITGGDFTYVGALNCNHVARNGTPMGSGLPGHVSQVRGMANGDVAAIHSSNTVARWSVNSWTQLGTANGYLVALVAAPNGDLIVGGQFSVIGGVAANNIARWDGSSWSAMGSGLASGVSCATFLPSGDLAVGGEFTSVGGASAGRLARWDGTTWSTLGGSGLDAAPLGIAVDRFGRLIAGGSFFTAGGGASANLATLVSTCPANATSSGAGCNGNTLVAQNLPWAATTLRSRGTGLPHPALVVAATSIAPIAQGALPLSSLFAQALPGCDLLVAPDLLQLYATTTGSVDWSLFLPNAPAFVGQTFFHQMIPLATDPVGNVTTVVATNALQLTVGWF